MAIETIADWSALFLRGTVLNDTEAFDYVLNTGDALNKNVNVVSVAQPVPEPDSGVGWLVLGAIGASLLRKCKQKLVKK